LSRSPTPLYEWRTIRTIRLVTGPKHDDVAFAPLPFRSHGADCALRRRAGACPAAVPADAARGDDARAGPRSAGGSEPRRAGRAGERGAAADPVRAHDSA